MDGVMDVASGATLTAAYAAADVDLDGDGSVPASGGVADADGAAAAGADGGVDGGPMAVAGAKAEGDPKPEGDAKPEGAPEPGGKDGDELLAGIPEKSKERISGRFAQLTARAKSAEERLEAQSAELEELRGLAHAAESARAAAGAGIPKVMLAESESEIAEREAALEGAADALRDWVDEHGSEDEFVENGKSYSFAQVKQALRNTERELNRTIPRAREALKLRAAAAASARKLYPNVLKAGTAEAAEARRILAAVPGLRALPNWPVLVGRMIAGKALESKAKAPAAGSVPPRAPVGAGAAAAAARRPAADARPGADLKRVEDSNFDTGVMAEEIYGKALEL